MRFTARALTIAAAALLLTVATTVHAQTAENILLVVNETSPDSIKIGDHYARVRAIPADNVLRIQLPVADQLPLAAYQFFIEQPIASWFAKRSAHDRIHYIVLTKGVPLRIAGTVGRTGTTSSVDSELTLLYRKMVGTTIPPQGQVANPFYLGTEPVAKAKRFNHRDHDIFLVTRLDGYTAADVIAMIDRGLAAAPAGDVVLDQKADLPPAPGEGWLKDAAVALNALGFADHTVLETTTRSFAGTQPVIGYYSWGSNDPALRTRGVSLNFAPGAIAAMFLSSDARTFKEPPAQWVAGDTRDAQKAYAGSPQSLAGDLVRSGVTGTAGYVAEPFSDGAIRPDMLFPAYVSGFNLAEAFYLATPYLGWQSVVVGDPLCSPFASRRPGTDETVQAGVDPATELSTFFAARRLKDIEKAGLKTAGLQAWLRGEVRFNRGDIAGAREALEAATATEPRLVRAHHRLAEIYDAAGEHELSMARYRMVLEHQPNDGQALNNLAYALAVHGKDPQAALPLARRAHDLLKAVATADTLGWVLHLTGDSAGAAILFNDVVRTAVKDPEILLHAATVFAAAGRPDAAARELSKAVALDKNLETREDVKTLRARLARDTRTGASAPQ